MTMDKRLAVGAILILAAGFGAAHAAPQAANDGTVVVHTDAGDITVADVRENLNSLPIQTREAMVHNPDQLNSLVRVLAAQKLLLKEADEKGWDKRPEVVSAMDLARRNAMLQSYLADRAQLPKDYPAESEVLQAYESNKTVFSVPRKFHLAQIFIASPVTASADEQDKAQVRLGEVLAKLKASNSDFAAIAASESEDAKSSAHKGDLGLLPETQLDPKLRAAVTPLARGGVSEPVRLDDGWHVVKVLDIMPASTQPLSEVRDQIVQSLREQKRMADERSYIDKFTKSVPTPDAAALSGLVNSQAH